MYLGENFQAITELEFPASFPLLFLAASLGKPTSASAHSVILFLAPFPSSPAADPSSKLITIADKQFAGQLKIY